MTTAAKNRIAYLDGLRGVAIALVLIWHFFGPTYARFLPYGDRYGTLPVVSSGWMGVQVFFLISGFVIFMTVEKCSGFGDFMKRRLVRIWPAFIVASVFLLAIDMAFRMPGPYSSSGPEDLLPTLTFVPPAVLHGMTGLPIRSIDGPFWTLYLEMLFYLIFGVLYYRVGWEKAVVALVGLALASRFGGPALTAVHAPHTLQRGMEIIHWFGLHYLGWFASGALFYKAARTGSGQMILAAIAIGLLSACLYTTAYASQIDRALLACVVLGFAAVQRSVGLQRILASRIPVLVGFISYPLYLIHNNLGVGLIATLAEAMPHLQPEAVVPLVALTLMAVAWVFAKHVEPWLRALVQDVLSFRLRQRPALS